MSCCLLFFPVSSMSPSLLYSYIGGSPPQYHLQPHYAFLHRPLVCARSPTCIPHFPICAHVFFQNMDLLERVQKRATNMIRRLEHF